MSDPNQLNHVKDLITYLKVQKLLTKGNPVFCRAVNNSGQNETRSSDLSNSGFAPNPQAVQSYLSDNLTNETKKQEPLNTVNESLNKNDVEVQNIISKLKEKREQNIFKEKISEETSTANTSYGRNATVVKDKCTLDTNGEIVRKVKSNFPYSESSKRQKTSLNSGNKQLHLTSFYSIVKPANSNNNTSKSLYSTTDNCVQSRNFPTKEVEPSHTIDKTNSGCAQQKPNEEKIWDIFRNIKKRTCEKAVPTQQRLNRINQKKVCNKEVSGSRTFDEICNDLLNSSTVISSNIPNSTNTFLKSFSTGNITKEKGNNNETNSVPITSCELDNTKKQLGDKKITFDDFLEGIFKKLKNRDEKENTEVAASEVYSIRASNSENASTNTLTEKLENCNNRKLASPVFSQSSHQHQDFQNKENGDVLNTCGMDTSVTETGNNVNCTKNVSEGDESLQFLEDIDSSQYVMTDYFQLTQDHESIEENIKGIGVTELNSYDVDLEKEPTVENVDSRKENTKNGICDESNETISADLNLSLGAQINLLDDGLEKSVLSATYKEYLRTTKKDADENNSDKLETFLKKVIPSTENKENQNKFDIKRYRKGKTRIYKLKKLKRKQLKPEDKEDLNFQDLLKKITSSDYKANPRLVRFNSGSTISTSSSYVPDDGKSDNLSTGSKELTSPQQRLRQSFNEISKDKSLCYPDKDWEDVTQQDKERIKMKIQNIFFQILNNFKNKTPSYLKHRRQTFDNCIFKDGRLQLKPATESSMTIISSQSQRSKAKFQLMLYIMKKIQTLLETDTKLTKRELYYQLKALISDQYVTDRAINAISCVLDVGMWALNIIAQKGLVFGNLKLFLSSGETLNCNIPGTMIPPDINQIVEVHSLAYFILVVEKESIFFKLIEEDLPNKLTRPFIMITGKGFPDLNTQLFLRKLWMVMSIPVFILVDADPHGINIMLNYRFGSVNNAHVSQHLAVPKAKWLGVYPSEVINFNIERQPLNEREIKLIKHILKTPYMNFSPRLVEELNILLKSKHKAGIEGLIKTDTFLSDVYLPNKFFTNNFI